MTTPSIAQAFDAVWSAFTTSLEAALSCDRQDERQPASENRSRYHGWRARLALALLEEVEDRLSTAPPDDSWSAQRLMALVNQLTVEGALLDRALARIVREDGTYIYAGSCPEHWARSAPRPPLVPVDPVPPTPEPSISSPTTATPPSATRRVEVRWDKARREWILHVASGDPVSGEQDRVVRLPLGCHDRRASQAGLAGLAEKWLKSSFTQRPRGTGEAIHVVRD